MSLRERLRELSPSLHGIFLDFVDKLTPLLNSIEIRFPEFTRHDPSHVEKIERIAYDIMRPEAFECLTADDVFALLCAIWGHDAGMAPDPQTDALFVTGAEFNELAQRFLRLGKSRDEALRDYVRQNHHRFCPSIAARFLGLTIDQALVYWIGQIAESHGNRDLHDLQRWPNEVAVSDSRHIRPRALAVVLRMSDILHFNADRAPGYMQEHRNIRNSVSVMHWRAHQVAADYTIDPGGTCFFDGVTADDEAFWFAKQFVDTMDEELRYCIQQADPSLPGVTGGLLRFARVTNRVRPSGFAFSGEPIILRLDTAKFLSELLNSALYSHRPAWLRELIQNAFDACRDRRAIDRDSRCHVSINFDRQAGTVTIDDTGVGMTGQTAERYLLVGGASYWQSEEYRAKPTQTGHVGKFGIGFMSVFSVAKEAIVETQHVGSDFGVKLTIRDPDKVVRIEKFQRASPGTTVTLLVEPRLFEAIDLVKEIRDICECVEFQTELLIDGLPYASFPAKQGPTADDGVVHLIEQVATPHRIEVYSAVFRSAGLDGIVQYLKTYSTVLACSTPLGPRWGNALKVHFDGNSKFYFGGVAYPALSAIDAPIGFTHLPQVGNLRVAVSPAHYALEMNLSREHFVSGPESVRCLYEISRLLDAAICADIQQTISSIPSDASGVLAFKKSALVAQYSSALMGLWLGQGPSLSYVVASQAGPFPDWGENPWSGLSSIAASELLFTCLHDRQLQQFTISELRTSRTLLFAGGFLGPQQPVSNDLSAGIASFDADARLLLGIPAQDFGMFSLRYWATEEWLVPIFEHGRSAYGLSLGHAQRPHGYCPRELDHLGIPCASGPSEWAALDYRDFMAEREYQPTGSPVIVACLNRKNRKVQQVIRSLQARTWQELRALGLVEHEIRSAFSLGQEVTYNAGSRKRLATAMNKILSAIRRELVDPVELFNENDFPAYFDGGRVIPFGRPALNPIALELAVEAGQFTQQGIKLS